MSRLVILVGLAMALALVLPDSTGATSFNEVKKLLPSDAPAGEGFGWSVAVSGDTAVVGVRPPTPDGPGGDGEAAYVFQRDQAGKWGEVTKLTASDGKAGDRFGDTVAIGGDIAVIGALGEDAQGRFTGAAYVFQRDQDGADNWGEVRKLTASDAQPDDFFGISVAVSGDTAVVGARGPVLVVGVAGDGGAAYVFQRDQGGADNWGQVTKLTHPDATAGDSFGDHVAITGDTVVVAGGGLFVLGRNQGSANNWGQVAKLTAADGPIGATSVALSGDTVVVGAVFDDDKGELAGAAYVFQRDQAGNWGEVTKLTTSDAQAYDQFGISVAVNSDTAVVGADRVDAGGGRFDDFGAAYVFRRNEGGADNWGEVKKLVASDAQAGNFFGQSVALSGDTAIVGAAFEDAGGIGAGAAYVFQELSPTATATDTSTPTAGSVEGTAELPDVEGTTPGSSGPGAGLVAGIGVAVVASVVVLGGAAWYARKRLAR